MVDTMTNTSDSPSQIPSRKPVLGLPVYAIIGLALLAAPRVVLHDLDLISEGTVLNAVFVFLPPVIWIVVAVLARARNPFLTLLAVGACYGLFLAVGHQVFWGASFGDSPPQLGGNLANLDPGLESLIVRSFAAVSSVFTGVIVGAITGLIAWGVSAGVRRSR